MRDMTKTTGARLPARPGAEQRPPRHLGLLPASPPDAGRSRRYNDGVRAHECHHCKQWVEEGEAHDCWTTTEAALTSEMPEDLLDAYERIREAAVEFGDQRIYASGTCIMFSRKSCYFFVRPRRSSLQLCVFLGRTVRAPQVRRVEQRSKTKAVHIIDVTHRDQVEAPITDWLREAYGLEDAAAAAPRRKVVKTIKRRAPRATKRARRRRAS